MFGIGFPELVVIFIVALLVLGPERLPEVARSLAKWVNEFRRAADELKKELGADALEEGRSELEKVRQELLKKVYVPPPAPESEEVEEIKSAKRLEKQDVSSESASQEQSPEAPSEQEEAASPAGTHAGKA